jgi:hypothetical protein
VSVAATIRSYLSDAARAFTRAPVEVALALMSAIAFSYAVENSSALQAALHIAVATGVAACAAWSATLMHGLDGITARTRWIITLAGGAFAAAYLVLTDDLHYGGEVWRAFMLTGAALLFTFSAPALPPLDADPNLRLRRVNARVLLRAAGIILYGLALFGGLALALAAIDNLFELKLEGEIYGHVFIWIMLVLVPWVIVGGIDEYVRPLEEQSDVARVVHRLVTYLVPLLVAIYFLILYVYVVRIAVTGELPRNLVSPMVIAAGLLSLLSLILFAPSNSGWGSGHGSGWETPTHHPTPQPQPAAASPGRWLRYTPLAYLPLVPLGFWALITRFQDYGWTEFRMLRMVALLAVFTLALIMAARVVRRRSFPLRVIPLVLAFALLLPAIGPWSALAVSRRDQQSRLTHALREARVDPNINAALGDSTPRRIPQQLYDRIVSGSSYLSQHFGMDAVTAAVPAYLGRGAAYPDLAGYFRLVPLYSDTMPHHWFTNLAVATRTVLSDGVAYRLMMPGPEPNTPRAELRGDTLYITIGADSFRADIRPALTVAQSSHPRGPRPSPEQAPASVDALAALGPDGTRRGDLMILGMSLTEEKGVRRMTHLDAILLVRQ